jgi:hypothetical protein
MSYPLHHYLAQAVQQDRLEEARRARLARSVARGRRPNTLQRFSVRRALATPSVTQTATAPVPSTSPSVCPS